MAKVQLSLKARALRYLAGREHSRQELARKLARFAQDGEDIEALLDQLEAAKLLSQERFAESLVHRRAGRFGNSRILSELQSHGLDREALEGIKGKLSEDEARRAGEVRRKKFEHFPANPADRAKQMRFLQQRGFSTEAIRIALRAADGGND